MVDTYTRRRALLGGASALAIGLAGCSDDSSGTDTDEAAATTPTPTPTPSGPPAPDVGPVGPIPQGVTVLARADAQALLSGALFAQLESTPLPGVGSASAALSGVESEFGLDPEAVSTLLAFQSSTDAGQQSGAVLTADWSDDTLSAGGAETSKTTYAGRTLYVRSSGLALGVLGGDQYAVGQRPAVESVVDVAVRNADPATGGVVSALQRTPEGRASFAVSGSRLSAPGTLQSQSDGDSGVLAGESAANLVADISMISGSLSADGDQRTLSVTFDATEDTAALLVTALNPTLLRAGLPEETTEDPNVKRLLSALETAEVTRDGASATLTYTAAVAEFAATIEAAAGLLSGTSSQ